MPSTRETRLNPGPELRTWVAEIGVSRSERSERRDAFYGPRAEASILMRWNAAGEPVVNVLGPLTRARRKSFFVPRQWVRILLRAGRSRSLLGVPVHELANQVVPIEELWGDAGKRLRDDLVSTDAPEAVRFLETALLTRLRSEEMLTSRMGLLTRAMQRLDGGVERVATIAEELGVSDRHLRRVFQDDLGMTPKHYGRISRLHRVLAQDPSSGSWAHLAQETGFHDQSHLIRDFRDLLQATPSAFRKTREGRNTTGS